MSTLPALIALLAGRGAYDVPDAQSPTAVDFRATVTDPDANNVALEIEVKPVGTAFTNTASGASVLVPRPA